jgi:hypothetical protein
MFLGQVKRERFWRRQVRHHHGPRGREARRRIKLDGLNYTFASFDNANGDINSLTFTANALTGIGSAGASASSSPGNDVLALNYIGIGGYEMTNNTTNQSIFGTLSAGAPVTAVPELSAWAMIMASAGSA